MTPSGTHGFAAAVETGIGKLGKTIAPKLKVATSHLEEQLRAPVEVFFGGLSAALGLHVVAVGEQVLADRSRPDFTVSVGGAVVGHLELKAPGHGVDPTRWSPASHDRKQWERIKELPNLLYCDGEQWALYRSGVRVGAPASLTGGDLARAGAKLQPADDHLATILFDFLTWAPKPPRNLKRLVESVAGLCRLLRSEVLDALALERLGINVEWFTTLARDWRALLFPDESDEQFADQYAQTVTFALLLARVEGISFDNHSVAQIAKDLGKKHSLMGKALDLLADDSLTGVGYVIQSLCRVIGVVDWDRLDDGTGDAYLHLYERFLALYDSDLRKKTGSYYTPNKIVSFMTGFVEDVLAARLNLPDGYATSDVAVLDPAMGTGTFLLNILDRVAARVASDEGEGARGSRVRELASRLIGIEKQTGPFAVAELRLHEALQRNGGDAPSEGLRIYVGDTLANPYAEQAELGSIYAPIAKSRAGAERVKRDEPILVVIGNPPYMEKALGSGGWVEAQLMKAYRTPEVGRQGFNLNNLYAYFWRFADWKVFEAHQDSPTGVVAFITLSSYLNGAGFAGMREHLRRNTDEGWIIDLSPEAHRSTVSTRVFAGVQQPICIGVFVRHARAASSEPSLVHHISVPTGHVSLKYERLASLGLSDPDWRDCPSAWDAPFLPLRGEEWEQTPKLGDLMPWSSTGVTTNRKWVTAPDPDILKSRWNRLRTAPNPDKRDLLKVTRDRNVDSVVKPLPGYPSPAGTIADETEPCPTPVRVGFRAFDRQFLIADSRVIDMPRPPLWQTRGDSQLYVIEQHDQPVKAGGPGLIFSALIPDVHLYSGRGGRAIPLYRDASGERPNIAPGLLQYLEQQLSRTVSSADFIAYVAAITAHRGYTETFVEQLKTPGVRVPLTANSRLWGRAVELGSQVVWLHTFGERFADVSSGRLSNVPALSAARRPKVTVAIQPPGTDAPDEIAYDPETLTLCIGPGRVQPVEASAWNYHVSGVPVIKHWFGYRQRIPAGKRSSPLDSVPSELRWHPSFTTDLLQVINVLTLLGDAENAQAELLAEVLAGDQVTAHQLIEAGVLPVPESARKAPSETEFDKVPYEQPLF